jgi:hypothetical protein
LIEKACRPAAKADGHEIRKKKLAAAAQTARHPASLSLDFP